jgi:hypothetical protein
LLKFAFSKHFTHLDIDKYKTLLWNVIKEILMARFGLQYTLRIKNELFPNVKEKDRKSNKNIKVFKKGVSNSNKEGQIE